LALGPFALGIGARPGSSPARAAAKPTAAQGGRQVERSGRVAGPLWACDARLNGGTLKLTVISLRHDPEIGFDVSELASFCEAHDVQAWTEHFFIDEGRPGSRLRRVLTLRSS